MGRDALSELEIVVLLAVLRLEGDAYGVTVMDEIRARTGRRVLRGSVYIALERLESRGLVRSSVTAPLPVRGGRSRRVYQVTPLGERALRRSLDVLRSMAEGLQPRLRPSK